MKPPICEVCDERFDPADGDLIRFVDTPASKAFDERMEEPGFVGHSPSSGWFCSIHVDDARSRADSMTLSDALRDISGHSNPPPISEPVIDEPVIGEPVIGEPLRGPFLPMPDPEFDAVATEQHPIAGRIASDIGTILRTATSTFEKALGVANMRNPGSIGAPSTDRADLSLAGDATTCSTTVHSRHGGDVAIFRIAARHLDGDELLGEHVRLLVQQRERSIVEVVVTASPEAAVAPDGRVLLDRAHIRVGPEHASTFADAITSLLAALHTPAADPFSLSPDLEGVDLRGGEIRRSIDEGESSIEWTLRPVALQTARQHLLELVPTLFDRLELGAAPELVVTRKRDWNPMDGAVAPNCPYVDHVRHEPAAEGPSTVSVSSDAAHWSDTDISNVSTHLFINVDGERVSAFASGRGDHDACTRLSLFRPTSPEVVDALTAAFTSWLD